MNTVDLRILASEQTFPYFVTIPASGYAYLEWASDRGYDGGILDLAEMVMESDCGTVTIALTEASAWEFSDNVSADWSAFLSCCGCSETADALCYLIDEIV